MITYIMFSNEAPINTYEQATYNFTNEEEGSMRSKRFNTVTHKFYSVQIKNYSFFFFVENEEKYCFQL